MGGIGRSVFVSYDRMDQAEAAGFIERFDPNAVVFATGAPDEVSHCVAACRGDYLAATACLRLRLLRCGEGAWRGPASPSCWLARARGPAKRLTGRCGPP